MTEGEWPSLVDTGNGLTLRYRNRNLYSPSRPMAAADKRATSYDVAPGTLLLVPSPLLFYGIEGLLERLPQDSHLLCIEVDQKLMRISLDNVAPRVLRHPSVTFVRTDSIEQALQALRRLGIGRFRRTLPVVLNGGYALNRESYAKILRAVDYEIQSYWRNRMTLMHMAHLWIKNFFINLPVVANGKSVSELKIDSSIVVAGAGESLETAAPLLRSLRERYYLLAVDTAVRTLCEFGLSPDGVTVLDAQFANLADFVGFDPSGVDLIADITAFPECLRRFTAGRWFFFSEFAQSALFSRARAAGLMPTTVPPLGSVGIAALYCALMMTDRPVFFTGLDFSYRPGKTHARGAPAYVAGLARTGRLHPFEASNSAMQRPHRVVEGKRGLRVWTDSTLEGYGTALDMLVEGRSQVYDIGTMGLPRSAPLITDPTEVERLLFDAPSLGPKRVAPDRRAATDNKRREMVRRFLLDEKRRVLEAVDASLRALREGHIEERAPADVSKAVRELDYSFIHFADWSESPRLNEGFLKRFVEAAETRAVWIDHALAQLEQEEV